MVADACNLLTSRGQAKDDYMFKASLAYIMSSRIARAIRQDPILKNYDQKKSYNLSGAETHAQSPSFLMRGLDGLWPPTESSSPVQRGSQPPPDHFETGQEGWREGGLLKQVSHEFYPTALPTCAEYARAISLAFKKPPETVIWRSLHCCGSWRRQPKDPGWSGLTQNRIWQKEWFSNLIPEKAERRG